MSQKTKKIQLIFINGMVLVAMVGLSGCTSNQIEDQITNENVNTLLGTWRGTLQMPMFDEKNNATISQISFIKNRTEMVLRSENRTFTMNYTYTATNDTLVLTPLMTDRNGFPDREQFNGTLSPNMTMFPGGGAVPPNGTQPPGDRTWPPNGTNPYNGTWPSNRTRTPGDMRLSMTVSFSYAVEEETRMLLLNNVQFTKVQ